MAGSASATWTRPSVIPCRARETSACCRLPPGPTAATTRTWPSWRAARFSISVTARSSSRQSASSMITTVGTCTDVSATARAVRAKAPSCPAGLSSHALPAAPTATPATRNPTAAASPDTNRPPTPRPIWVMPPSRSSPSSSATGCRVRRLGQAVPQYRRLRAGPLGQLLPVDPGNQGNRGIIGARGFREPVKDRGPAPARRHRDQHHPRGHPPLPQVFPPLDQLPGQLRMPTRPTPHDRNPKPSPPGGGTVPQTKPTTPQEASNRAAAASNKRHLMLRTVLGDVPEPRAVRRQVRRRVPHGQQRRHTGTLNEPAVLPTLRARHAI